MKKILFAYQVFSMIALFPAIAFLEMNHGTGNFAEKTPLLVEITKTEVPCLLLHVRMNDSIINNEVTISFESILLKAF